MGRGARARVPTGLDAPGNAAARPRGCMSTASRSEMATSHRCRALAWTSWHRPATPTWSSSPVIMTRNLEEAARQPHRGDARAASCRVVCCVRDQWRGLRRHLCGRDGAWARSGRAMVAPGCPPGPDVLFHGLLSCRRSLAPLRGRRGRGRPADVRSWWRHLGTESPSRARLREQPQRKVFKQLIDSWGKKAVP